MHFWQADIILLASSILYSLTLEEQINSDLIVYHKFAHDIYFLFLSHKLDFLLWINFGFNLGVWNKIDKDNNLALVILSRIFIQLCLIALLFKIYCNFLICGKVYLPIQRICCFNIPKKKRYTFCKVEDFFAQL